ncbi:putative chromatin regulator PHD family [Helianthus annuus]|nr:putative chromatin regulator PHD family [Helianthus annuus]
MPINTCSSFFITHPITSSLLYLPNSLLISFVVYFCVCFFSYYFLLEKEKKKLKMFEHEHPLNLTDLWSEQLQRDEDYEEDKEENEDEVDAKQDFRCLCSRCHEEINWFHRYYYSCSTCSDFSIHKFCAELPERLEDICEVGHTLGFYLYNNHWICNICRRRSKPRELLYRCDLCDFYVDANCATKRLQNNIIHHPSHRHPLVRIPRKFLGECDACGKEHKGLFYHCPMCVSSKFIHSDCAFLPKKLQIQHTTNDIFSHIHPLTLAYSFPKADIISKINPRCRVCLRDFYESSNLWIYKCEKCRYYTHLDCATSRKEPFMSILTSPGRPTTLPNIYMFIVTSKYIIGSMFI